MSFAKKRIPKHLIIYENHGYPQKRKRSWRWLTLTTFIFLSSLFFALQSRAETLSAGELRFKTNDTSHSALHLDTEVTASINGLVAHVVYQQRFKNNSADWQEGVYMFPLPETAGINYMEMRVGNRVIVGEIKEKLEAKRIYTQALKAGKRAALTEQQRPNMFRQRIANIAPGEEITVLIKYQQKIDFQNKHFEWRLPTTFTPRYMPGVPLEQQNPNKLVLSDEDAQLEELKNLDDVSNGENKQIQLSTHDLNDFGWATATDQVPDAQLISPRMKHAQQGSNPVTIKINLESGLALADISSLYHDIKVKKVKTGHTIELQNLSAEMDRDFVLQWTPVESKMPRAALFSEEIDNEFYSLLMLIPPTENSNSKLARDIIFIIDTSGSMQGPSINQAKESLAMALQQLSNVDRFNVIEFNSKFRQLFNSVSPATQDNVQRALNWVHRLQANGGTEMHSALKGAFKNMPDSERLQQIVFITDGAVGNEKALLQLIHQELDDTRLFTVGIGSAPNSYFMRKAAEFGRGSFSHIGNLSEVTETMTALFLKLNSAVSTQIDIDWQQDAEQYPSRVGELYRDEALLVTVKTKKIPQRVNISGELNQRTWQQSIVNNKSANHKGVGSLWARHKIESLEDQHIAGLSTQEQNRKNILDVALRHKLISRFTSFVAVENVIARNKNQAVKHSSIANQVAKGQSVSPVMLPNTATTGEIAWWFGLFGFISLIIVLRMRGEEQ